MSVLLNEPIPPTPDDQRSAQEAIRTLQELLSRHGAVRLSPSDGSGPMVQLPTVVVPLLLQILRDLSRGNAVTIFPVHAELTTQQAADLLGVSRPFIIKQLESGRLRYHMAGSHRRIHFNDFAAYRRSLESERAAALDELSRSAQEDGDYR